MHIYISFTCFQVVDFVDKCLRRAAFMYKCSQEMERSANKNILQIILSKSFLYQPKYKINLKSYFFDRTVLSCQDLMCNKHKRKWHLSS